MQRGALKDVSLAGTYEFGGGTNATNILTGVSFAWDVPGTTYFNSTFYYVNNSEIADDLQMTLTWGAPFEVGASRFLFDGYIDYSTSASDHDAEFHFNPQLKLDLGTTVAVQGCSTQGLTTPTGTINMAFPTALWIRKAR